ncbi:MAG: dihydroorotase [Clostridia bacterium]
MYDTIIKNGIIATASDTFKADILIKNELIVGFTSNSNDLDAKSVIDASGKFVMPGFIDTHVHSRDGVNGAHYKEDFFHSSMAGAVSGFTTIYEMPNCNPAVYNVEMLNSLINCITKKAHVDFGVWGLCLGDLNINELEALSEAGVVGFKFFWGYAIDSKNYQLIYNYRDGMENVIPPLSHAEIFRMFQRISKTGKRIAIHAEDFDVIKALTDKVMTTNDRSYEALLRSRPALSETTVIQTAVDYAKLTGAKLHILHMAAGGGVDIVKAAQDEGFPITGETCPHYLALTNEDATRCGSSMKGYPPVREKHHQDKLWEGLKNGTLSIVCSDHAPHSPEEKQKPLFEAPAGMASIETMSLIMLDAVNHGKLTLNKLVEVLSTNPAKLFGTYPKKGNLNIGADADIVIVDIDKEYTFHQNDLHSRTKLSPYNGFTFKGKPIVTILRGNIIAQDGEIVSPPSGRFIKA